MKTYLALVALLAFAVSAAAAPQLAFTFDDLPAHSVLPPGMTRVGIAKEAIVALKAAHIPAVHGFTNAALINKEPASAPVLKLWRKAGFVLGNHTWSHMNLGESPLAADKDEIIRDEPVLAELSGGTDWHWFRYPYLSEGNTPKKRQAIRSILAERGYKIASVTMMFGDWLYSEPYARCLAKGDQASIAELKKDYFAAAEDGIRYYRAMSQAVYGRDIPYVLLLHIGAFEAKTLPRLIDLYRSHGFQFVTLAAAESDPYYRAFVDPSLPAPPASLEDQMKKHGLKSIPPPKNYGPELAKMCR